VGDRGPRFLLLEVYDTVKFRDLILMFSMIFILTIESVSKDKKKHSHLKIMLHGLKALSGLRLIQLKKLTFFFIYHRIVFSHSF